MRLAQKVLKVSQAIGCVEKNGLNAHFKFKYQAWDDVKKLVNKVIEVNQLDFSYTGWNSDRNIACFKHKHKTVGIIRN